MASHPPYRRHDPSRRRLLAGGLAASWAGATAAMAGATARADATLTGAPGMAAGWGPAQPRGQGWYEWRLSTDTGVDPTLFMDPDHYDLWCEFEGPNGLMRRVNAFWSQDEQGPHWTLRFLPPVAGRWRLQPMARLAMGAARVFGPARHLDVAQVLPHQHVGIDPQAPSHFAFEDGRAFVPVGLNICWGVSDRPLEDYRRWLTRLAAQGGNFVRLWMASWSFGIEWKDTGLGQYRQRMGQAAQLDAVFELAESLGIRIMLCLLNHGAFSLKADTEWQDNPYNRALGGPLSAPEQFVSDERALTLFERRVRYICARWAHSPALHSWEWWNEVTWTPISNQALQPWLTRLAGALDRYDPYRRLRTTSWADRGDAAAWQLPALDFAQQHDYTREDPLDHYAVARQAWQHEGLTHKPVLAGELGLETTFDAKAPRPYNWDAEHLHNGLWAPLFLGYAGTALYWWWDQIIDPFDMWPQFHGIARFVQAVEDSGLHWGLHRPQAAEALAPRLRAQALVAQRSALVWVRDAELDAGTQQRKWQQTSPQNAAAPWQPDWATFHEARIRVHMPQASDGPARVRWYDTRNGERVAQATVLVQDSRIELTCPDFTRDLAAIVIVNA
jgi:hypothetical protein